MRGLAGSTSILTPPTVTYNGKRGELHRRSAGADHLRGNRCDLGRRFEHLPEHQRAAANSFGKGLHSYSATATKKAGNVGHGSTSFTVSVTPSSLQALINRFCTDPSVAASLDRDVTNIAQAPNAGAKAGALQGFNPAGPGPDLASSSDERSGEDPDHAGRRTVKSRSSSSPGLPRCSGGPGDLLCRGRERGPHSGVPARGASTSSTARSTQSVWRPPGAKKQCPATSLPAGAVSMASIIGAGEQLGRAHRASPCGR